MNRKQTESRKPTANRKWTAMLLILTLLLAMMPVTASAIAEDNLLVNPGFEDGMTGWTDPDDIWAPVESEQGVLPVEGSYFVWPSSQGVESTYIYQDVPVQSAQAGKTVVLEAWMSNYDQAPHDMGTLELDFLGTSGTVLATHSREQRDPVWTLQSMTVTIPAGTATARVILKATRYVGSDDDAYYDAMSLRITSEQYAAVQISGPTKTASAGDAVQLVADNGTSTNPADYLWSTSYASVATVDEKGLVAFVGTASDEVLVYAKDKTTGVVGTYRFNSVTGSTDAPSIIEPPAAGENPWSDSSAWAVDELQKANELGLYPDALKGKDLTEGITRAEFAAVCVKVFENLSGETAVPAAVNPFTDCSDAEVLKAYRTGISNGTTPTTFSPDLKLNREQAATMLTRVYKRVTLPGWTLATDGSFALEYAMPARFADEASISAFAKDSVYFMAANGILNGVGGNRFAPRNATSAEEAVGYANATREQALIIAARMVQNLGN